LNCKSLIAFLAGTVALSPGLLTHAASPDFLWARPATNRLDIGHGGRSAARSVASDSLGNVFVAGEFTATSVRFGGVALTNTTSGQGNFLCKYDPSGTLLWARLAGTNSGNRPLSVAVDASTNVYIAGYISGTGSFGTNSLVSAGPLAIFIAKYDGAGQALWARQIDAYDPAVINPLGLSVAPDGSVFLAGRCNGTANFGNVSLTNTSAFLAKYNSNGDLLFARGVKRKCHRCHWKRERLPDRTLIACPVWPTRRPRLVAGLPQWNGDCPGCAGKCLLHRVWLGYLRWIDAHELGRHC